MKTWNWRIGKGFFVGTHYNQSIDFVSFKSFNNPRNDTVNDPRKPRTEKRKVPPPFSSDDESVEALPLPVKNKLKKPKTNYRPIPTPTFHSPSVRGFSKQGVVDAYHRPSPKPRKGSAAAAADQRAELFSGMDSGIGQITKVMTGRMDWERQREDREREREERERERLERERREDMLWEREQQKYRMEMDKRTADNERMQLSIQVRAGVVDIWTLSV